jgi:hypothetical protein
MKTFSRWTRDGYTAPTRLECRPQTKREKQVLWVDQPSTLHDPIPRFTQRMAVKRWGYLGHLMDDLSHKQIPPKRSQSWGISNLVAQPQDLGLHKKPPNRRAFHGFGGARSPRKEAQGPHVWLPRQMSQRNVSKTPPRNSQEKALKITKKGKWKRQQKPWGTTTDLLYIPRKVHTRSKLPPNHPSLSQDLTMNLSS